MRFTTESRRSSSSNASGSASMRLTASATLRESSFMRTEISSASAAHSDAAGKCFATDANTGPSFAIAVSPELAIAASGLAGSPGFGSNM